jgi:hypothetical protein
MKLNDAKHPLSGFVALQQIVNFFNCNPQGTALQMKRRLIKMIENTPNNPSFGMYKINQLLQDMDLKMANINMKTQTVKRPWRGRCCKRFLKCCAKCAETPRMASTPPHS